jgi:hypothetical protein
MMSVANNSPTDGSRPNDDDAPILAFVCADASRMRVVREHCVPKRVVMSLRRCEVGWLARTRKCKTGRDTPEVTLRQPGDVKTLQRRITHRGKTFLQPKADVRRPPDSLPNGVPKRIAKPGPTAGAAPVDPEEESIAFHASTSCSWS